MSDFTKEIVDKLKEVRQKKGLSQRGLAQLSGVSQEMIAKMETGRHKPTIETVGKLAKAMGLKLDLVEDSDV